MIIRKKTSKKKRKYIGSDCVYCSLEQGVHNMMYFCRKKSTKEHRKVCDDGFTRLCPDYKKDKKYI